MQKKFTLTVLSILLAVLSYAQNATVKGQVLDEVTGKPVEFMNVYVESTKAGAVTDLDGKFTVQVPPGKQTIVFSSVEYGKVTETLDLKAGETREITKKIQPIAVEIETFVKTEGKYEKKIEDVTVTLEVLKPNIVENKNATSAEQSLQQVPGVIIVDSEPQIRSGSGYSFGAGSRVMVMVDDQPLLSGDAGRPSWGFIPIENLEQIEVIKGASSVLYGSSALNGVINIRTAYPKDKPLTKINFFTGFYNLPGGERNWTNRLSDSARFINKLPPMNMGVSFLHSRKIKNLDLVVGGNIFGERGFVSGAAGQEDTVVGKYDTRYRFNFNTRYRVPKKQGLSIGLNGNFLYGESANAFLFDNDSNNVFNSFAGTITETKQTTFNIDPYVSYSGKNGSAHNLRTRYYYLDNNNNNNQGNSSQVVFGEYQYSKRFLGEKERDKKFLKHFMITTGVMTNYTIGKAQLYAGDVPDVPSADSIVTNNISTDAINFAAYAQIENKFFKRLTVSLGARLEYFRIGKYDSYNIFNNGTPTRFDTSIVDEGVQPVFRGGLNFKAAEYTFIRASFGQGYRFPTIAERFINTFVGPAEVFGNPDLKPETSWSAELGVKQGFRIGKKFKGYLDVAGYYQYYNNYIEFTAGYFGGTQALNFKSFNIGRARMYGVDFSVMGSGNFGKNWTLTVLAGYNYTMPEALDRDFVYATTDGSNLPLTYNTTSSIIVQKEDTTSSILKYRFRHSVKLDAEVTYKMVSFGVSFRYTSFMENIDNAFIRLGELGLLPDQRNFRNDRRDGDYIVDLRAAVKFSKWGKISLIVNNVANRVYALRPASVEAPRQFIIQLATQF